MPDQAAYTTNYHPWEGTVLDLAVNTRKRPFQVASECDGLLIVTISFHGFIEILCNASTLCGHFFFFNAIGHTLAYTHLVPNPFFFFSFFFGFSKVARYS